jgi:nicotinamidase-related amidase
MLTGADHPFLLDRAASALLVVDVQEAFRDHVDGFDAMVARISLLVRGAALLDVPIAVSEQYPSGLGATVAELRDVLPAGVPTFDKLELSAIDAPGWQALPAAVRDARQLVVVGIETHVCVRQTVLGLLAHHREVHVPVDAVASRDASHRDVALRELSRAGAREATVEQALFDWLRVAGTTEFKAVQALLR